MARLTVLVLLLAAPAVFAATPAEKCTGAKLQAFGKLVDARAKCLADARKSGDPVKPACLAKADAKLQEQFAKAEKDATCPGDAGERIAQATSCAASFDGAIGGDAACVAAKIKAAGKKAAGKRECAKKLLLKGAPLEPCIAKVEEKFAKAVTKAESKKTCSGTVAALEALVDACLAEAIPCSGGSGHPTCDGSCPDGLACRPYEVFSDGSSTDAGCSCVDVANGPSCGGTTCGADMHCDDPTYVCERWTTGDGCDHSICQPAMTTPTTLPPDDKIVECSGGAYPTCGGTCPEGRRCQSFVGFITDIPVFTGCVCVDPTGPRCGADECVLDLVPSSHCADPSKACIVDIGGEGDHPVCLSSQCGDAPDVTTTTTTSSTSTSSSSTSTSITTTTSTIPCVSTPATSGSFQDLGNCTILDTSTGLQWEKKTDDIPGGLHDVEARYPWAGCCDWDCSSVETHCQPDAAASATCYALADSGTEGCGMCATGTCQTNIFNFGATTTIWGWLNQVNADNFAGHDDWRIAKENGFNPGPNELETILLMPFPCTTDPLPCINPIFGPTKPETYWSASTKGPTGPTRPSDGWFVDFLHGNWGDSGKWGPLYVRAVRDAG